MTNLGPIKNPSIQIKPSKRLYEFIADSAKEIKDFTPYITTGKETNRYYNLLTDKCLSLKDLRWLCNSISRKKDVYFHELFQGSKVMIPENYQIPRNEELENRCEQYRNEFNNKEYHRMTGKFSFARKRFPKDSVSYQLKQMNKHTIAALQFIFSVIAGFAFGFMGIELMTGTLDFGFRLILGIVCALLIALAEVYFLAKKLNEDAIVEDEYARRIKSSKLD